MPSSRILRLRCEWPVFHMTGRPPWLADVVHQHLRALDVEDDLGAGMPREEIAGEEGQDQVRLVAAPSLVDDAHAVGVAVVGDAHVGARPRAPWPRGPRTFSSISGSGRWLGKRAVRLAVQLDHLAAEPAQQLGGEHARDAVARVHHHLEPAAPGGHGRRWRRSSPRADRAWCARPRPRSKSPVSIVASSPWISSSVSGAAPGVHHLHAVVGDGIVAARDGGAAVQPPVRGGEVQERRVVDADVHHVEPGGEHAGGERLLERPRTRSRLSCPSATARPPRRAHEGAVGAADRLEHVGGDVDADLAAHVVGAEDERVQRDHDR